MFKLDIGNDIRNFVVLELKGQDHRVNKAFFTLMTITSIVNAHLTDNSNTAWV